MLTQLTKLQIKHKAPVSVRQRSFIESKMCPFQPNLFRLVLTCKHDELSVGWPIAFVRTEISQLSDGI